MADQSTNKGSGGIAKIAFFAVLALVLVSGLIFAPEHPGLAIHPMDQFQLAPLFQSHDVVQSFDASSHMGVLASGAEVALTNHQVELLTAGKEVSVNLWAAGVQKLSTFTVTNQTLWMVLAIVGIVALLVVGTSGGKEIPTRAQSVAELAYGFVYKMVEDVAGKDAVKYFPGIMTLFMFIVFANFLGLIPMSFTSTSHIAVTAVLALIVFVFVTVLGFVKNGAGFLGLFWVSSAPLALRPILAVIELISYFVRPVSHSIRLAGNVMAGHAVIKVFAGFAAALGLFGFFPIFAIAAVYALEVLVAFIQAYVFTILTCVYLKDALHPSH